MAWCSFKSTGINLLLPVYVSDMQLSFVAQAARGEEVRDAGDKEEGDGDLKGQS
jgi:hypothetical protein